MTVAKLAVAKRASRFSSLREDERTRRALQKRALKAKRVIRCYPQPHSLSEAQGLELSEFFIKAYESKEREKGFRLA